MNIKQHKDLIARVAEAFRAHILAEGCVNFDNPGHLERFTMFALDTVERIGEEVETTAFKFSPCAEQAWDDLRDEVGKAIRATIQVAAEEPGEEPDWHDSSEIDRLADAVVNIFKVKSEGTSSLKYKAELYDECWDKAKSAGFANVTMAIEAATKGLQLGQGGISLYWVRLSYALSDAEEAKRTDLLAQMGLVSLSDVENGSSDKNPTLIADATQIANLASAGITFSKVRQVYQAVGGAL